MPESTASTQKSDRVADLSSEQKQSNTFICSRDTLDGAYPSLMLAINARRLGMEATIFFTFMGINVIRRGGAAKCKFFPAGTMGAIPGMSAFASWMMRKKIDAAGIPALNEMIEIAQLEGVRLAACKMTVDMMGLDRANFIEGVEIVTAEEYMKHARNCNINMFT